MDASPVDSKRREISLTLERLRAEEHDRREREKHRLEVQKDATRSLIRLMQLDTRDSDNIASHAHNLATEAEVASIHERMRRLQTAYQVVKKESATINDKKRRHERVQQAKRDLDGELTPLCERLKRLDPAARPYSTPLSFETSHVQASASRLPAINGNRKVKQPNYREVIATIRDLKQSRKSLLDPYIANLKLAKLWKSVREHERSFEEYEKACKPLSKKHLDRIPQQEITEVTEKARLRRREAYRFFFTHYLQERESRKAAESMSKYLELSLAIERPKTLEYLDSLLTKQDYIEDHSLTTQDAIVSSILCSNSLGYLTDLRLLVLQEMLERSPNDPYLLESVMNIHVRKGDYEAAKQLSTRFVALSQVKQMELHASFAEFHPIDKRSIK